MATNDFKSFATGAGANVLSQADYLALSALLTGFQSGKASSAQVNKAIRQATTIAALVGQFIANANVDALDNGDVDALVTKFTTALTSNLGLKTASKRDVGTGTNQLPDMSSFSKGTGYFKLPSGKIIQWVQGTTNTSAAAQINYPIPFPSGASSVIASAIDVNVPNWVAANIYQPGSCLVSAWDSSKVRAATGVMIIAIGE